MLLDRGAVVLGPSLRGDDGGATRGRRGAPHQEGAQICRVDDRWAGQGALRRLLLLLPQISLLLSQISLLLLLLVRRLLVRLLLHTLLLHTLLLHALLWRLLVHLLHSL